MLRKLIFFFPVQLLLVTLKRNHLLLLLWIILFGFISKSFAIKYGIPYLFLAPEYLDSISFWSYSIVGFAFGGFVMTFHITSYIINSKRFPFIAALKRPFVKFCINNSLLPLLFMSYYIFQVVNYHLESENTQITQILIYIAAIVFGYCFNVMLIITYFLSTNKNIFKILGGIPDNDSGKPAKSLLAREETISSILRSRNKWHVESYLQSPFRVRPTRPIDHYDSAMLKSIITQNHINASVFEFIVFASLIVLGAFGENEILAIPAGASIILFFTIITILVSAFYTWLKGWTAITIVSTLLLINYLSKNNWLTYDNMAYGLNYTQSEKADYNLNTINKLSNDKEHIEKDYKIAVETLNRWKSKDHNKKLVFINTSGGGSRSMLWTFYLLQLTDSLSNGKLFSQTHLISGSSGGMIGAAYFRQLYLNKDSLSPNIYDESYLNNISKDLLNPVALSIATNDMFIRLKKYNDGKYIYTKDRGYAFEKQLLSNTNQVLDKRLSYYSDLEQKSNIPGMIFSPTIINDGRRLLISSQPISFLTSNQSLQQINNSPITDNVEFSKLFKKQDANNLKFTSALRMSATFPIIMPKVSLPSSPQINVMDAGMRDNFGKLTSLKYIYTFKEWINKNTNGIIIINLRDKPKHLEIKDNAVKSIAENIFSPVGSLYDNLFTTQDYNQEQMLQFLSNNINKPVEVINFELNNSKDEISLSWHLTTKDKERVVQSIKTKSNQESLNRLLSLIKD